MTEAGQSFTYLDANIIIHLVEGHATKRASLERLIEAVDAGKISVVTSDLTIGEVMVKPLADPSGQFRNTYMELLDGTTALQLLPVSRSVIERSAELRATSGGKLADAIHVASAELAGCRHFISEDTRIRVPAGMVLVSLDGIEHVLGGEIRSS